MATEFQAGREQAKGIWEVSDAESWSTMVVENLGKLQAALLSSRKWNQSVCSLIRAEWVGWPSER